MLRKERQERELCRDILIALRGIEYQLHTLAASLRPVQKEKDANSADNPAHDKQELPSPAAFTIITESSERDSKQHKREYQQEYWLHRKALQAQRYLLVATLMAFGAASYYAYVAKQQRDIMSKTLDTQERAYLAAGPPHQIGLGRDTELGNAEARKRNADRQSNKAFQKQVIYYHLRTRLSAMPDCIWSVCLRYPWC